MPSGAFKLEREPVYSCWAGGRRRRGSQEHTGNSQIARAGEPGACVGVQAAEWRDQGAAFSGLLRGGGLLCRFSSPPTCKSFSQACRLLVFSARKSIQIPFPGVLPAM